MSEWNPFGVERDKVARYEAQAGVGRHLRQWDRYPRTIEGDYTWMKVRSYVRRRILVWEFKEPLPIHTHEERESEIKRNLIVLWLGATAMCLVCVLLFGLGPTEAIYLIEVALVFIGTAAIGAWVSLVLDRARNDMDRWP